MLSNKDKIRTEAANWWRQMFMPSSAISLPRQSLSGRLPKSKRAKQLLSMINLRPQYLIPVELQFQHTPDDQARVAISAFLSSGASAEGRTRRKVVPRPTSVTK